MKKNSGFTLVELLLVVLVIIFLILLAVNLPSSLGLVGNSHFSSLAKDIATQKIEDLRAQTYDNLANGITTPTDSRLSNLPLGSITQTITDCSDPVCTHGEQLKQVNIQVDWTEKNNSKNIQLTTFIAKGGLKWKDLHWWRY